MGVTLTFVGDSRLAHFRLTGSRNSSDLLRFG